MRTVIILALIVLAMLSSCERMSRSGQHFASYQSLNQVCVVQDIVWPASLSTSTTKNYKIKVLSTGVMAYTSSDLQFGRGDTILVSKFRIVYQ